MDHGSSSGGSGLEEKVLIVDIFFIERHLLRLIGHQHVFPPHDTAHEANVRIDVGTAHGGGGSWVVKRRDGNVIVNNRDTISPLFLTIDAALEFRTTRDFWGATGAGISLAEAQRSFRVNVSGNDVMLQQTWAALTVIGTEEPSATPIHSPTSAGSGGGGGAGASRALGGLASLTATMGKHRLDRALSHGSRGGLDVSPLPRNVHPQTVLKVGLVIFVFRTRRLSFMPTCIHALMRLVPLSRLTRHHPLTPPPVPPPPVPRLRAAPC